MESAGGLMRRRSSLVEHPFGTLKCRAGYRHFLVRGLDKVRGEWSLMALCYNFSWLLNILGFDGFVACLASRQAISLASIGILRAAAAIAGLAKALIGDFRRRLHQNPAPDPFSLHLVT